VQIVSSPDSVEGGATCNGHDLKRSGVDRRALLKRISAAGAVAATSSVVVSSPAFAAAGTCCSSSTSYTLVPTCQPNTTIAEGCVTNFTRTITVCRTLPTRTMLLSRFADGTQRPYFDEVGTLTVTSPTSVVRSQNYIGYQADCRGNTTLGDLTDYGGGNGSACGSDSPFGPTDVSALFGNECGFFTVTIECRNGFTPYGYSTCYLRPN
jgi:hypothetical protein